MRRYSNAYALGTVPFPNKAATDYTASQRKDSCTLYQYTAAYVGAHDRIQEQNKVLHTAKCTHTYKHGTDSCMRLTPSTLLSMLTSLLHFMLSRPAEC